MRRRFLAAAVIVAAVLASSAVAAGSDTARAATVMTGRLSDAPNPKAVPDGADAAAGPYVECRVATDPPLYFPEINRIVGSALVRCSTTMPEIELYVSLVKDNLEIGIWDVGSQDFRYSESVAGASAWTDCVPGTYETKALVGVVFPAWVTPPTALQEFWSAPVSYGC